MSESLENADCSFTFDTSLSAEFDLTMYAGIIYELAVVPPQQKKLKNRHDFLDLETMSDGSDICEMDEENVEMNESRLTDDFNQTHLTEELNQIFSYFDETDDELATNNSEEEFDEFCANFSEIGSEDSSVKQFDGRENKFETDIDNITDTLLMANENVFVRSEENTDDELLSDDEFYENLSKELGVGNVREKVLLYNEMLEKINADLEAERNFFRKNVEKKVNGNGSLTKSSDGDFVLLSRYVGKLLSIESYAQILSRLNRLVNALSQLDKNRLASMNAKSLKNFLSFIKIYSHECVNMSAAIRKEIIVDLEKKLLTNEDLLYCLDVVANEVTQTYFSFEAENINLLLENSFFKISFFSFLLSASRE